MSRYRQVATSLWTSRAFRELGPMAPSPKALLLYLLTGPETSIVPGVVPVGVATLAEALEWSAKDTRAQLAALERSGLVRADLAARLVWVPGQLVDARPQNPNIATGWARALAEAPECDLRDAIVRAVVRVVEPLGEERVKPFRERFGAALATTVPEPLPNGSSNRFETQDQDQEQEQIQEQNQETKARSAPPLLLFNGSEDERAEKPRKPTKADQSPADEQEVFDHWLAGWRRVSKGTREPIFDASRRNAIRKMLKSFSVDDLKAACDGMWRDVWHVEHRQWDVALVCRDAAHVEKFRDTDTPAPTFQAVTTLPFDTAAPLEDLRIKPPPGVVLDESDVGAIDIAAGLAEASKTTGKAEPKREGKTEAELLAEYDARVADFISIDPAALEFAENGLRSAARRALEMEADDAAEYLCGRPEIRRYMAANAAVVEGLREQIAAARMAAPAPQAAAPGTPASSEASP